MNNKKIEDKLYQQYMVKVDQGIITKMSAAIQYLFDKIIWFESIDMECFLKAKVIAKMFNVDSDNFSRNVHKKGIIRKGSNGQRKRSWGIEPVETDRLEPVEKNRLKPVETDRLEPVETDSPHKSIRNIVSDVSILDRIEEKDDSPDHLPSPLKNTNITNKEEEGSSTSSKCVSTQPPIVAQSPPSLMPIDFSKNPLKEGIYELDSQTFIKLKQITVSKYRAELLNSIKGHKSDDTLTPKLAINIWEKVLMDNGFGYKEKKASNIINKYKKKLSAFTISDFVSASIDFLNEKWLKATASNFTHLNDVDFFSSNSIDHMLKNEIKYTEATGWADLQNDLGIVSKKDVWDIDNCFSKRLNYRLPNKAYNQAAKPWDA